MKVKTYIKPNIKVSPMIAALSICGASIEYGGEDGPGIAEGKERNYLEEEEETEIQSDWGNLW